MQEMYPEDRGQATLPSRLERMMDLTDLKFVIEVEEQGIRKLYGPVDTLEQARAIAGLWIDQARAIPSLWVENNQSSPHASMSSPNASIRHLYSSLPIGSKSAIDPNQTTVDEQIRNAEAYAEDYIDPATVR